MVSITNPGGFNPVGEPPEKLIDGVTTGSKWLDYNFTVLGARLRCTEALFWS